MMDSALLTLFSRIQLPAGKETEATKTSIKRTSMLNLELAYFGYSFDHDAMHRVSRLEKNVFDKVRKNLIELLGVVSGDSYSHTTLFAKFPYNTPDQYDYFFRRVIGHLENKFGIKTKNNTVLSCGHVINHDLFNLDEFGVCPICQFQVNELADNSGYSEHPFANVSNLKAISIADAAFIRAMGNTLIARPDSLNQTEKLFLIRAITEYGIDLPETISFREQIPFAFLANPSWFDDKNLTAADVLRLAVFVSDPEKADLSLKINPRFNLTTSQKKTILRLLNNMTSNVLEDMMRDRERWLRLGERLNPNSEKNKKRYPQTAAFFDAIRNNPSGIETFGRTVHKLSETANVFDLAEVLKNRPGEFARRLDFMLRNIGDKKKGIALINSFEDDVVSKVTTKLLFELRKYFEHRFTSENIMRAFYPKGNSNRVQIIEDNRKGIDADFVILLLKVIDDELRNRFSGKENLGKVYIDPVLKGIIMPFNARGDSATNVAVIKGAQYPMDAGDVLRFFVHWTGNTDVDLSAQVYNADMVNIESIGFYNTRGSYASHSGDIQNAPNGASEFIDINIEDALNRGARYIAMVVYSFRGENFSEFSTFAGYMMRDSLASGKKYEPASVRLKFNLTSDATSYIPLVFDIVERKVIFADMPSGNMVYSAAYRQNKKIGNTMNIMFDMVNRKPTMYEVLSTVVGGRSVLTNTKEDADLVFDETTNADSVLEFLK